MEGHAKALALAILGNDVQEDPYRERTFNILFELTKAQIEAGLGKMQVLRATPLPGEIWSGSGGTNSGRAIALEVLRRGGHIVRFGHGTPLSFIQSPEINGLVETGVSSSFSGDRGIGEDMAQNAPTSLYIPGSLRSPCAASTAIRSSSGFRSTARSAASAPGPMWFMPHPAVGISPACAFAALDIVYLDWQLRVAEALNDLPIELVCQPHPEGLLRAIRIL